MRFEDSGIDAGKRDFLRSIEFNKVRKKIVTRDMGKYTTRSGTFFVPSDDDGFIAMSITEFDHHVSDNSIQIIREDDVEFNLLKELKSL